jgi:xylan 1,4-beta-xylosidase
VLNLFRMLGLMSGDRVKTESSSAIGIDKVLQSGVREAADIDVLATRGDHSAAVLLWNYFDHDVPAADASVKLTISGLPKERLLLRHYRIDQTHSNAYTVWKEMGSPQTPTTEQYAKLKAAGQLELLDSPRWIGGQDEIALNLTLPRQSVSLLELSW